MIWDDLTWFYRWVFFLFERCKVPISNFFAVSRSELWTPSASYNSQLKLRIYQKIIFGDNGVSFVLFSPSLQGRDDQLPSYHDDQGFTPKKWSTQFEEETGTDLVDIEKGNLLGGQMLSVDQVTRRTAKRRMGTCRLPVVHRWISWSSCDRIERAVLSLLKWKLCGTPVPYWYTSLCWSNAED